MALLSLEQKGLFVLMEQWKNRRKIRQQRICKEQSDREFLRQVTQAKQNLQIARDNFNYVTNDSMLEYYIYMIKAEETKLNYYLALAKEEHRENAECFAQFFDYDTEKGCG